MFYLLVLNRFLSFEHGGRSWVKHRYLHHHHHNHLHNHHHHHEWTNKRRQIGNRYEITKKQSIIQYKLFTLVLPSGRSVSRRWLTVTVGRSWRETCWLRGGLAQPEAGGFDLQFLGTDLHGAGKGLWNVTNRTIATWWRVWNPERFLTAITV